jgi:hypothetical protein
MLLTLFGRRLAGVQPSFDRWLNMRDLATPLLRRPRVFLA